MFSASTEYSRPRERDEKESPFFVPQERGFRREKEPSLFFFRACRRLTVPLTPRPRPHPCAGGARFSGGPSGVWVILGAPPSLHAVRWELTLLRWGPFLILLLLLLGAPLLPLWHAVRWEHTLPCGGVSPFLWAQPAR